MANVSQKVIRFKLLEDQPIQYEVSLSEKTSLSSYPRILASQVHGDLVLEVNSASSNLTCDGLITQEKGLLLSIRHADCQAALFFDPKNVLLAVVHSGWKGSVQNIYKKTVEKFLALGSDPKDILVCIGPSLGPSSAEFIHYQKELPSHFHRFQIKPNFFDFWAISKMQLINEGILDSHIDISSIDTFSDSIYHSYRREKTTSRMTTNALLAL